MWIETLTANAVQSAGNSVNERTERFNGSHNGLNHTTYRVFPILSFFEKPCVGFPLETRKKTQFCMRLSPRGLINNILVLLEINKKWIGRNLEDPSYKDGKIIIYKKIVFLPPFFVRSVVFLSFWGKRTCLHESFVVGIIVVVKSALKDETFFFKMRESLVT